MEKAIKHALDELNNVRTGDIFVVRDLWVGHIWNRISIADRLLIGRLFYNAVKQQNPCPIEVLEKTKDKQQKYRKI
jgi:hypothetical protein